MYNKYFTMKRSELKEAIKAEIKSVLTEEIQVGDIVTLGGDGDELEVIDSRRMFGSDMMAYRVKKVDGTKFNANVDFPEIGDETVEYSADQLRPARMMNEGKRGVVVDPDEIMMHINQYQSGNIDGDDLAQAIEEILVAMMSTPLREAKSAADVDKEVKDLESKMKDKAKDFKAAEGKAKDKIKDELKDMTTKRNDLKKKVEDLKKKEEEKIANKGKDQELDA